MSACTTEFFHANVFAGYGLYNVWPGNEHVRGLVDHDDKVGQRRRVNRTTGGRAHDD